MTISKSILSKSLIFTGLIFFISLLTFAQSKDADADWENTLSSIAPVSLNNHLYESSPLKLKIGGRYVSLFFYEVHPGLLEASYNNILVKVTYKKINSPNTLRYTTTLTNRGKKIIKNINIKLLWIAFNVKPWKDYPRVRYFSGSYWADAKYPPVAFRESEELFAPAIENKGIENKAVEISSGWRGSSYKNIPLLQFALGPEGNMNGFTVGFEWSANWNMKVGWYRDVWNGETLPPILISGNVGLKNFTLNPGETLRLPRVDIIFSHRKKWDGFSNDFRTYLRMHLIPKLKGNPPMPPVSYDHWFGLYTHFNVNKMKKEAKKAAQIGCEYFVLDAAWYPTKNGFMNGLGNWYSVDPNKFPNGEKDMISLSKLIRKLGMKFGLWQSMVVASDSSQILKKYPDLFKYKGKFTYSPYKDGTKILRYDLPKARKVVLERIRYWYKKWHVRWMRWESLHPSWTYGVDPTGKLAMKYIEGYYAVIDTVRKEFPDFYIEDCQGGGTRLDLGMISRTDGAWLNDFSLDPDVCRFFQTGALRILPSRYLNSAVEVDIGKSNSAAYAKNFLSRMTGTLSIDGDIAGWNKSSTTLAEKYISIYKNIRHLYTQPIYFPLDQPRNIRDWDAVVFGNGKSQEQLLYVYRILGKDSVTFDIPHGKGKWKKIAGSNNAMIRKEKDSFKIFLPKNGAALWERNNQ